MYGSVLPETKLAYHVMGQRIPSRVMPMSGKKEKSQRQIRFPYCGAVAVIWPTAEITRILGGLMNCMSAAIILTASPMLPSRIPMVWLCAISPPRPCTLYLISVKIRYKAQIKGSFPKSDFFLKVKKTPDFIRNQVFYVFVLSIRYKIPEYNDRFTNDWRQPYRYLGMVMLCKCGRLLLLIIL